MSTDHGATVASPDLGEANRLLGFRVLQVSGAGVPADTLRLSPFSTHYRFSDRPYEPRDEATRLGVTPVWWFDIDSRPCFILGTNGAVFAQNPAASALIQSQVLVIRGGVLGFGRAQADEALMEAIEAVSRERAHRKHVVVLGQDDVWRSLTLHMAPSDQPMIFLSIRTQARTDDLAMEPLIEAFHLTPAQAKVVMGLASGLVPKEIARRMDVSTHTVRTHLRAVYGKLKVRGIAGALRLTSQLLD